MKISSDLIWAIVLLGIAVASFFLGVKRGELQSEDQLGSLREEIKILSAENQQLSEELESRGVYSYPQANVVSKMQDSVAMVLITLNGKDHIPDLKLRRNFTYNYSEILRKEAGKPHILTDLGTLKPHNPAAFDISLQQKEVALHLAYEAQSKSWNQYIWIKRSKDNKIRSFWVITNQNAVVIDKHMDPGFPTDAEGNIVLWDDIVIKYSELELNSIFQAGY